MFRCFDFESEGNICIDKKTTKIAGIPYLIIVIGSILGGVFSEMYIQSHLAGDIADGPRVFLMGYIASVFPSISLFI